MSPSTGKHTDPGRLYRLCVLLVVPVSTGSASDLTPVTLPSSSKFSELAAYSENWAPSTVLPASSTFCTHRRFWTLVMRRLVEKWLSKPTRSTESVLASVAPARVVAVV